MNDAKSRLIVALDVPDRATAMDMAGRLSGHVGYFKVGLELFVREGPRLVEEVKKLGQGIFLDLKFHDIPNTVAGAVRSACSLGINMLTLHAAGGQKMLESAAAAAESATSPPLLLAVTALTSLSPEGAAQIGVRGTIGEWVEELAQIAREAGIRGLVSSPLEVARLRQCFKAEMKLVVPGIRPFGTPGQDQSRSALPGDAIRAGADFIVVGRPILQAADPIASADAITEEIAGALAAIAEKH